MSGLFGRPLLSKYSPPSDYACADSCTQRSVRVRAPKAPSGMDDRRFARTPYHKRRRQKKSRSHGCRNGTFGPRHSKQGLTSTSCGCGSADPEKDHEVDPAVYDCCAHLLIATEEPTQKSFDRQPSPDISRAPVVPLRTGHGAGAVPWLNRAHSRSWLCSDQAINASPFTCFHQSSNAPRPSQRLHGPANDRVHCSRPHERAYRLPVYGREAIANERISALRRVHRQAPRCCAARTSNDSPTLGRKSGIWVRPRVVCG